MSVSTFRNPGDRRRSFFEDFIRPQTVNIADRDDGARRHAAREARGTDERQRCQYTDALNRLKPAELLPEELQFLQCLAGLQQPTWAAAAAAA
ncbi:hypothetical protein ColTof4_01451 [Colletotrichum tofieldiae]|nr:hypothetical protein ColTof3_08706 [Colletotrichum tofieldiae]GKT69028.1 hypothetical protein ColTof4_01451 [Colletotrichum tofieldiae]GKT96895.1 hypothetical protein Ct61P_14745 [Colletotrichum tofieldiae]